jgi:hypothetical protein
VPEEFEPLTLGAANEPLLLSEECVELRRDDGSWAKGSGRTSLDLLPHPSIQCRIDVSEEGGGPEDDGRRVLLGADFGRPLIVRYPERGAEVAVLQTSASYGRHGTLLTESFGAGSSLVMGSGEALSRVAFRVMNFPEFTGRGVLLEADGWQAVLYAAAETAANLEGLKSVGGYALTHLGDIRRGDGGTFTAAMFDEMQACLHYLLAFAAGSWAPPMLPVGYDAEGHRVWELWELPVYGPRSSMVNWFNRHQPSQLTGVFPGFLSLYKSGFWAMELRRVVHWYVSSNQALGGVDGALILAYTALELLAWVTLVEDWQVLSKSKFKDLKGGAQIEALLDTFAIPTTVPTELTVLAPLAQAEGWSGPASLSAMRNSCVHPEKRDAASTAPEMTKVDVWQLALWYIELVLLRLCDYNGTYVNRVRRDGWRVSTTKVPWST